MKRLTCCLLAVLLLCTLVGCRPEAVTLTGLRVDTPPARTVYTAGEAFDRTGMTVTGLYSDGGEAPISAYTVSPATLSAGDTAVTVRYKDFTVTVPVTVSAAGPATEPATDAAAARLLAPPHPHPLRRGGDPRPYRHPA